MRDANQWGRESLTVGRATNRETPPPTMGNLCMAARRVFGIFPGWSIVRQTAGTDSEVWGPSGRRELARAIGDKSSLHLLYVMYFKVRPTVYDHS